MGNTDINVYLGLILGIIFIIALILCGLLILAFESQRKLKAENKESREKRKMRRESNDLLKKDIEHIQTLICVSGNVDSIYVKDGNLSKIVTPNSTKVKVEGKEQKVGI